MRKIILSVFPTLSAIAFLATSLGKLETTLSQMRLIRDLLSASAYQVEMER